MEVSTANSPLLLYFCSLNKDNVRKCISYITKSQITYFFGHFVSQCCVQFDGTESVVFFLFVNILTFFLSFSLSQFNLFFIYLHFLFVSHFICSAALSRFLKFFLSFFFFSSFSCLSILLSFFTYLFYVYVYIFIYSFICSSISFFLPTSFFPFSLSPSLYFILHLSLSLFSGPVPCRG